MKIATWNVRGIGAENKKTTGQSIIKEENLDLVGLTETKHDDLSQCEI